MGPDGRRRPAELPLPSGRIVGRLGLGILAEACSELLEILDRPEQAGERLEVGRPRLESERDPVVGRPDFIGRKLLQEFPPPIEKAEMGTEELVRRAGR